MKKVSIVIPVYNEEKNIPKVYEALVKNTKDIQNDFEFIFINDGSIDKSEEEIQKLTIADSRVKNIEFSRNFGKEMATTAGIRESSGESIIMIDADLQHPPEFIVEFISRWNKGAEIVIGQRIENTGISPIKKIGSWFFYRIMQLISDTKMVSGETDFRLIDRKVADAFIPLSEHQRMTRSLVNWLGFKKEYVKFKSPARTSGRPAYSNRKLFNLAIHTFVSNSLSPLRFAGFIGLVITFLSSILGLAVIIDKYVYNDPMGWKVTGSGELAVLILFLIGIVLMMLGIMSLYIGNINSEVVGRPLYIVRKKTNFNS